MKLPMIPENTHQEKNDTRFNTVSSPGKRTHTHKPKEGYFGVGVGAFREKSVVEKTSNFLARC